MKRYAISRLQEWKEDPNPRDHGARQHHDHHGRLQPCDTGAENCQLQAAGGNIQDHLIHFRRPLRSRGGRFFVNSRMPSAYPLLI